MKSRNEELSLQDNMHPLQLLLLQRFRSYLTFNSAEDEWKWFDNTVDALLQYRDILEGGLLRKWPKQIKTISIPSTDPGPDLDSSCNVRDCLGKNTETTHCACNEL